MQKQVLWDRERRFAFFLLSFRSLRQRFRETASQQTLKPSQIPMPFVFGTKT
jgi:hypothetical protein